MDRTGRSWINAKNRSRTYRGGFCCAWTGFYGTITHSNPTGGKNHAQEIALSPARFGPAALDGAGRTRGGDRHRAAGGGGPDRADRPRRDAAGHCPGGRRGQRTDDLRVSHRPDGAEHGGRLRYSRQYLVRVRLRPARDGRRRHLLRHLPVAQRALGQPQGLLRKKRPRLDDAGGPAALSAIRADKLLPRPVRDPRRGGGEPRGRLRRGLRLVLLLRATL